MEQNKSQEINRPTVFFYTCLVALASYFLATQFGLINNKSVCERALADGTITELIEVDKQESCPEGTTFYENSNSSMHRAVMWSKAQALAYKLGLVRDSNKQ